VIAAALLVFVSVLASTAAWAESPAAPAPGAMAADLETLARGTDTGARLAAAARLGASRDPRALEALITALGDANRDVRWAAIETLGEIGDRRAVPPLLEYLKKPEAYRWGKRLAASALGAIGDPAAVDALGELLRDDDAFVRRLAALALVRIGDPGGTARVAALLEGPADDTLPTVRRELARAEEQRRRKAAQTAVTRPATAPAPPATLRPHEWAGVRVGVTRLADVREALGTPLQQAPDFLLYRGERFVSPLRVDSVVLNADARGIVESVFVFPLWGTLDRDVRSLLGQGVVGSYADYLKTSGRAVIGAGTRAEGKLHYLPPEALTEAYAQMGMLVVYDGGESAPDKLVKLIIVH
jgi:HEAT repeat protein/PBS lyase HEAT-like repeat-containing protein